MGPLWVPCAFVWWTYCHATASESDAEPWDGVVRMADRLPLVGEPFEPGLCLSLPPVADVTLSTSMQISGYISVEEFAAAISQLTAAEIVIVHSAIQSVSASVSLRTTSAEFTSNMTTQFTKGLCAAIETGGQGGCFGAGCSRRVDGRPIDDGGR